MKESNVGIINDETSKTEGTIIKKKKVKGNMTTKDPEMLDKIKDFNDANERYQERKKEFNAFSRGLSKGFIHKPQDSIALQMMNIQNKRVGRVTIPGAFGKGGMRKSGVQRGS